MFWEGERSWKQLPTVPVSYKVDPAITAEAFMSKIRKESFEVIAAFGSDGLIVTQPAKGDFNSVGFPSAVFHLIKDTHVIHNHPASGPPSVADLKAIVFYDVAAMTIVWRGGSITLYRPEAGWPDESKLITAHVKAENRAKEIVVKRYPQVIGMMKVKLASDATRIELAKELESLNVKVTLK